MKGKITKYLITKLIGKKHNGVIIIEDMIMAIKIEKFEFNVNNNPVISELDCITLNETRTLDIVTDPYETEFIML